jgi:hypothetical protein
MKKIEVIAIIEMMGKPADYLIDSLKRYTEKIGTEKGVEVKDRKISEPKKVENSELFTSFSELEINFENVNSVMNFIFAYMPAHIEIVSGDLNISNCDANLVFNELTRRLHEYDSIAKTMIYEKQVMENKIKELQTGVRAGIKTKKKGGKKK